MKTFVLLIALCTVPAISMAAVCAGNINANVVALDEVGFGYLGPNHFVIADTGP